MNTNKLQGQGNYPGLFYNNDNNSNKQMNNYILIEKKWQSLGCE